jgi:hypothetical protein
MALSCKDCKATNLETVINGLCCDCRRTVTAAWNKKMAVRQDPTQFEIGKLVLLLLTQHWMHECEIITDYMPPYPRPETRPTCQVRCINESGTSLFLRYSNGPLQGYFWDMYGEDMHSPELALIALSNSPAPPGVKVFQTHGR